LFQTPTFISKKGLNVKIKKKNSQLFDFFHAFIKNFFFGKTSKSDLLKFFLNRFFKSSPRETPFKNSVLVLSLNFSAKSQEENF